MLSSEMQLIVGTALVVLCIAMILVAWQRSARRNVTTLFLAIGLVIVLAGAGPLVSWQISSRLQGTALQRVALSDHRIAEPVAREVDGHRRLEIDIEFLLSKLPEERLEEVALSALQRRLSSGRFDLALVRVREPGMHTPRLYLYAYKKQLDPKQIQAWLQPDSAEAVTSAQFAPIRESELESYRTITVVLRTSARWVTLSRLLTTAMLPAAMGALDEALYDYIAVPQGENAEMLLIFAIVNEEFLRQYQSAGGRPEELGLLGTALAVPSVLVIVQALSDGSFHLGELSLVQSHGGEARRMALRDLGLTEEPGKRVPWTRLMGNFPQFPNLLAQMQPGERLIGLLRFPVGFDANRGFQIYYGSQWAALFQE